MFDADKFNLTIFLKYVELLPRQSINANYRDLLFRFFGSTFIINKCQASAQC